MEDVIDRMRKDISVEIVRGDAFHISFVADDPRTAMKVTERIASMYIDESLRDREVLADGTNQFLESQLTTAKTQLVEDETKLKEYKSATRDSCRRRCSRTSRCSRTRSCRSRRSSTPSVATRIGEQHSKTPLPTPTPRWPRLSRQCRRRRRSDSAAATSASDASSSLPVPEGASAAAQLESATRALQAMELRLKPEHPDLIRQKRLVGELQKKAEAEAAAAASAPPRAASATESRGDAARATRLEETRAEADSLGRQIAQKELEEERLRGVIAETRAASKRRRRARPS